MIVLSENLVISGRKIKMPVNYSDSNCCKFDGVTSDPTGVISAFEPPGWGKKVIEAEPISPQKDDMELDEFLQELYWSNLRPANILDCIQYCNNLLGTGEKIEFYCLDPVALGNMGRRKHFVSSITLHGEMMSIDPIDAAEMNQILGNQMVLSVE